VSVGPEAFGEDYLYFYEAWLTDEVDERQTELLWRLLGLEPGAEVVDVACGHGRIAHRLAGRGAVVTGLDADPFFLARARAVDSGAEYVEGDMRTLPFADASFDAVVSIEVIEHVEDPFFFWRELARIAKPGATVVVTTPNVLNINSRLRTLFTGFPLLFDPLPLDAHDPRRLGGHIHPLTPYYLAYGALRAGLNEPSFHPDRTKASAVALTLLLWPLLRLARLRHEMRWRRKSPTILDQNRALVEAQNGWHLLTSRSAVLRVRKPPGD
jgi:SAM-dependent methyltransferase